MKFVLKVLVLVFLVVVSKLAKDDTIALQKPVAKDIPSQTIFTSHTEPGPAPVIDRNQSALSVKFTNGTLQIN